MIEDYITGICRNQELLLPKTIEEYIDASNPTRFIDAYVDTLDMVRLGFKHSRPNEVGRPPYNPADLLKLFIHGYLKHMRSSRVLEEGCRINLETVWLMKGLTPDFKTIADFRKDNVDCIKNVFKEFVFLCRNLDLFGSELVGIDGSKFKAVNSRKRNFNQQTIEQRLKHIEEKIESYLGLIEENDKKEATSHQHLADREKGRLLLKEKIAKFEDKRKEYFRIQENMKESGQKEISLTDPESRLMKCGQGLDVCYNVETVVDSKNSLVVDYEVTNDAGDRNELSKLAKNAKEVLDVEKLDVTADKGFHKISEIKECLESGITPYVPEPEQHGRHKNGVPTRDFYDDKFVYDKSRDSYVCPTGNEMKLWNWFKEGKTGTNFKLYRTKQCPSCPFKPVCTSNRLGRIAKRSEHEEIIEMMRGKLNTEEGLKRINKRKEIVEHPFGTMKRAFNQAYLLLNGLRKVTGEIGFTILAYNMRRAINILGTSNLIAALGRAI